MVRSKPKKQKGDDAFQKRTQKVGRKKLAPATATRAEVHARTLRVATSATIGRATASIGTGDTPSSLHQIDQGRSTKGKEGALSKCSFAELLASANHYKTSNRASAFASMSRLLALHEAEDIQERSRFDPFAGFISIRNTNDGDNDSTNTTSNLRITGAQTHKDHTRLHEVTSLQKLKAFTSALDALTDTEEEVRRAALSCLGVLLRHRWLTTSSTGDPSQGGSSPPGPVVGAAEMDHLRAILHTIHVTLTHALRPVRLAGVQLLALLLEHGEPAALRQAAREVSRAQRLVRPHEPQEDASTMPREEGETNSDALEVETWMLALVRRVSALVLSTPHIHVLAPLLSAFLMSFSGTQTDSMDGGLPLESVPNEEADDHLDSTEVAFSAGGMLCATPDWCHPELVLDLFKELLPQWANAWKELMEMQLGLFRHEEKLSAAVALGASFAVVLTFLKQKELERRDGVAARGGTNNDVGKIFLSKLDLQTVKKLFFHKVPVTTAEILRREHRDHGSVQSRSPLSNPFSCSAGASGQARYNRVDFALVLAQVSAPLATLEEGWNSLYQYFHTAFTPASSSSSSAFPRKSEVQLSSQHLLSSLEAYLLTLRLFPNLIHIPSSCFIPTEGFEDNEIEIPDEEGKHTDDAHPISTAGLSHKVVKHPVRPRRSADRVTEKLLPFAPLLFRAVVQQIQDHLQAGGAQRHRAHHSKRTVSDDKKDAFVLKLLNYVTAIVVRLAQFPLLLPSGDEHTDVARHRRGEKAFNSEATHDRQTGKGDFVAAQALHDTFLLVPRLLFALRPRERVEEASEENELTEEDKSERNLANAQASRGDAGPRTEGVLTNYPAAVDNVVYQLLRVVWFMISAGHPLFSEDGGASDTFSRFLPTMRAGLQALFVVPDGSSGSTVHKGVLSRCTERTVELAQHILFYLNVRDIDKMQLLTTKETDVDGGGSDSEERERHSLDNTARRPTMSTIAGMADILLMLPPILSEAS
ncbi:unnamed protein product [Phytomonas sp. EM1]|nr:unnamed protein product [Phytomonas sp. EM1]|eukprot:CCW62564.1 unnamed protein product [Phytomonas sp. isolate EM1]